MLGTLRLDDTLTRRRRRCRRAALLDRTSPEQASDDGLDRAALLLWPLRRRRPRCAATNQPSPAGFLRHRRRDLEARRGADGGLGHHRCARIRCDPDLAVALVQRRPGRGAVWPSRATWRLCAVRRSGDGRGCACCRCRRRRRRRYRRRRGRGDLGIFGGRNGPTDLDATPTDRIRDGGARGITGLLWGPNGQSRVCKRPRRAPWGCSTIVPTTVDGGWSARRQPSPSASSRTLSGPRTSAMR